MPKKFEKILSFFKKKTFFFVLVVSGLFSPLYLAKAADFKIRYLVPLYWYAKGIGSIFGWKNKVLDTTLGNFTAVILTTLLQLPLFIANVFLSISAALLNIVTSPTLIDLPYTKLSNPIIRMGWTITRDLANMGIVFALIVIGIATILKLENYQAKKILPTLIVIALLINFTPVILGVVVDTSNILMHFFLENSLETSGFVDLVKVQWDKLATSWANASGADTTAGIFAPLGETIVLTFFGFIAGFIFLTFAFLFMFRYIAIWMLVILSPLAFVCYILPATKEYFSKWWNQFLQWCFVGVIAAFFLYLSNGLLALAAGQGLFGVKELPITKFGEVGGSGPATTGISGLLNALLPYYVIVGFLILGLVATLSISAMGASTIVNWSKKGQKWTGGKIWKGMNLGDRKIIPRIPLKDKKTGRRNWKNASSYLTTARDVAGGITKTWEGVPVVKWFRPEPLRKFAEFKSAMENRKKEITGPSGIEIERVDKGVYMGDQAAAAVDLIVKERGDSNDIINYYMKKYGYDPKKEGDEEKLLKDKRFLKDKRLLNAIEFIGKAGQRGKLERMDPRLALIGRSREEGLKAIKKAIVDAKPAEIANYEREVPENKQVLEIAMALRGEDYFRGIGKLKGGAPARQKTIDAIFSDFIDEYRLDKKDDKDDKKNWKKFMKHLGEKYNVLTPGIDKAIANPRMRSAGWGYEDKDKDGKIKEVYGARYISKEDRGKKLEEFSALEGIEAAKGGPTPVIKKRTKPLKPGEKTEEEKKSKPKK